LTKASDLTVTRSKGSPPDPTPQQRNEVELDRWEHAMPVTPRLSIGLPVYNGEDFLADALDALLGQTYGEFELIISDNASTDGTEEICRAYEAQDQRIRVFRQSSNLGCAPNHNFVVQHSRGELFKWASSDDLYARDLLERCVEALDADPQIVLAHSWTSMIDSLGHVTQAVHYPLATSSTSAPERFRSLLFGEAGDDDGGVIRRRVLDRTPLVGSYHHADRTIVAELALHGRFHQVPDWLYFRRDHPGRAERACPTVRTRCANLDPRRADRLRHPTIRLVSEYVAGYVAAIGRAPISAAEKRQCYGHLVQWAAARAHPKRRLGRPADQPSASIDIGEIRIASMVASQDRRDA
jgi:glycosyltransferase involved in cell wall biosynthesis